MAKKNFSRFTLPRSAVGSDASQNFSSPHCPIDELNAWFWWLGAMAQPVPIPNTEVKRGSGDDTLLGKVASRQNQAFN